MNAAGLPLPHLRLSDSRPSTVTHQHPAVGAVLAHYLNLLDGSVSVLIHGQQLPADAVAELSVLGANGLALSDLSRSIADADTEDRRLDTRDYGFIAFSTSGTSGNPKVVLYSKPTLLACAQAIAESLALAPSDHAVSYVRPSLAYGLSIIHSHYLSASPVEFRHSPTDPFALQREVAALPEACAVYLLPIQAVQLTYGETVRPSNRSVDFRIAGALLPSPVAERLRARYPNASLANMYGQSELGPRVSVWRGHLGEYQEGLVGRPLPGVSIHVDQSDPGAAQIWVASPYRMLRYLGRVPADVADGEASRLHWMRTGDLGYLTQRGDLVLTGRQSRQLNIGGELVPVSAITAAVRSLETVGTCRVVPDKHSILGERAVIWVIPASDQLAPADVIRSIRHRLRERLGRAAALSRVCIATREMTEEKL